MPSLEDIDGPTEDERQVAERAAEALDTSDRLGIVPLIDKETDERVPFLVAFTDEESDSVSMQPIGPVYAFESITEKYEIPDELSTSV